MLDVFVGRDGELALLDDAYRRVALGESRLCTVEGPAGIGKTALLRAAQRRLDLELPLAVCGVEAEATLRFGVVGRILRRLPVPIPDALIRLARGRSVDLDAFSVGAVLLEILGDLQDHGPVALFVEDVHWADVESQQALAFAFRRLQADRVLLVLSLRVEDMGRLPTATRRLLDDERSNRISLLGLMPSEVRELASRHGRPLSQAAAQRLQRHTGGNPLHVRALLEEIESAELTGGSTQPLRSPRSYEDIVRLRLERLRPDGRELMEVAAVLGSRCRLDQAACVAGLPDPWAAVDDVVAAGLLIRRQGRVGMELEFEHPLTHAAVYHSLTLGRRSAIHRAAVPVVEDEHVALQHEAAASPGPDRDIAGRLRALARDHLANGASTAAAASLLEAGRLSASRREREACILDAIDCHLLAGDRAAANALAGDLSTFLPSARRDHVMAKLRLFTGAGREAQAFFRRAWARLTREEEEGELAARIAGWMARCMLFAGCAAEAAIWAQRALRAGPARLMPTTSASLALIQAMAASGDIDGAIRYAAGQARDLPEPPVDQVELVVGRGIAQLWGDRAEQALDDLTRGVDLARERGVVHVLVYALVYRSEAEYRLGRWDVAVAHGELAASTATAAELTLMAACCQSIASFPHSACGRWEHAERLVSSAEAIATTSDDVASSLYAALARARLELMRGRPEPAARALESYIRNRPEPVIETGMQPTYLVYAEALYEMGDLEAMAPVLDEAEALVQRRNLATPLVVLSRLRGQLLARTGSAGRANAVFEGGLATVDPVRAPFEHARLQLAYGGFLRRLGRRRAAKVHLEAARERLSQLGAAPLLTVCDVELAGTGLRPVRRTVDERNRLTSQELLIASLVAEGMSNREVAARLTLSPRTVEYHLGNVFSKLGLRSRSQLVRHVLGHKKIT
jgi:ATP/maltotriose-dependent transcriptional regulator MalT